MPSQARECCSQSKTIACTSRKSSESCHPRRYTSHRTKTILHSRADPPHTVRNKSADAAAVHVRAAPRIDMRTYPVLLLFWGGRRLESFRRGLALGGGFKKAWLGRLCLEALLWGICFECFGCGSFAAGALLRELCCGSIVVLVSRALLWGLRLLWGSLGLCWGFGGHCRGFGGFGASNLSGSELVRLHLRGTHDTKWLRVDGKRKQPTSELSTPEPLL